MPEPGSLREAGAAARREENDRSFGGGTLPCQKGTWIELVLTQGEGDPVPGEAYLVVDSAGEAHRGRLDGDGVGRVVPIPEGPCEISFPDLQIEVDSGPPPPNGLDRAGCAAGKRHAFELGDWELVELEGVKEQEDEPPEEEEGEDDGDWELVAIEPVNEEEEDD